MLVGYARVSTREQDTALQLDALKKVGVKKIFYEAGSGVGPRPQLQAALRSLQTGDMLCVWKLDRMARSLADLLSILARLNHAGASIKSLTEPIDTSSPLGEFTFQILGAVAQLERAMIRERVIAGQTAARARGKTWGTTPIFTPTESLQLAKMWRSGIQQPTLAEMFGCSVQAMRDSIHRAEKRGRWAHLASDR